MIAAIALPRILRCALTLLVAVALIAAAGGTSGRAVAQEPTTGTAASDIRVAADLSQFSPGNIISDAVFFNSGSMTEAQIQSFLESKGSNCRPGYTCLKDWYDTSRQISADAMCGTYSGGGAERASRIIYKVSQACGINPQVILATLQKEQSLVTHAEPSAARYRIAMGQGCPDTAACDTRYYGFFNQVHGAAWQLKRYANPPGTSNYFTWYAPGKTWNIRYSPDASCGSSPVYVQNQATANLYYYTPYQPNAAALRAGYGTGDSCSAYGNRNFFQYFTDWFGSTQSVQGTLITGPTRERAYLLNNGLKHPISSPTDLQAFGTKLGGLRSVTASYLDSLPTGATATRYVHDTRTGTLFLLELDGSKHRFASAEQVGLFGYPFNSYINLESRLLDAFTSGQDVGTLSRAAGSDEVFFFENGSLRYVNDRAALAYAVRGKSSYIATMDVTAHQRIPRGATYFMPNTLVRGASSGDVLLTTPTSTVVHIPSFALAAEFGATSYSVVPDSLLAGSTRAGDQLAPILDCGGQQLIGANGVARPLSGDPSGLGITRLGQQDCAAMPRGSAVQTPLFVQARDGADVYAVRAGKLQHVHGYAQLTELNGTRALVVLRWNADTMAWQGIAAPLLFEGEFLSFSGSGEVYRHTAGTLRHITDYATLISLGGGRAPAIATVPAQFRDSYVYGDPIGNPPALANGTFVRFSGAGEIYLVADGQLRHITDYAVLLYLGGGREPLITTLPSGFSGAYAKGAAITAVPTLADGAFVQFTGAPEVYRVERGELRHVQRVETLIALGGNRVPPIQQLPLQDRATFRMGAPL